jgi:hypothetical protein
LWRLLSRLLLLHLRTKRTNDSADDSRVSSKRRNDRRIRAFLSEPRGKVTCGLCSGHCDVVKVLHKVSELYQAGTAA